MLPHGPTPELAADRVTSRVRVVHVIVARRKIGRVGVLLQDPCDKGPHVARRFVASQRLESRVDRFADEVRQHDAGFPQPARFAQVLFIEADIDQAGAHICKDTMSLHMLQPSQR